MYKNKFPVKTHKKKEAWYVQIKIYVIQFMMCDTQ